MAKKAAAPAKLTATGIISAVVERSDAGVTSKQAKAVIGLYHTILGEQLEAHGVAMVKGLVKMKAGFRKALPARDGRNPATGEILKLKPRKAGYKARAVPLKGAKDAVETYAKNNPAK